MKKIVQFLAACLLVVGCNKITNNPFWNDGTELFDVTQLYDTERFPNVVVATDGTIITTWGSSNYVVRRSTDGGLSWEPQIFIANPGFHGGGTIVDETSGDVLAFVEDGHPYSPLTIYRSHDHGLTWKADDHVIRPDERGNTPSMHMNERGLTLKHGMYAGRLIRAARVYAEGNDVQYWDHHYTNAIYSDDGGKTWQTSSPFPAYGTGEAAIEELSDGTLYYNSRRHRSTDGMSPLWRYIAWSRNGGQTWEEMSVSDVLPDGNQNTEYGLMAGLVRLPVDGHDILIFSNIDMPREKDAEAYSYAQRVNGRVRGTVWASFDGGKTWPVKRLVDEGSFAYSSLAAGREGTPGEGVIYLLYESNGGGKMARFNLAWLTSGRDWREFLTKP